MTKLTNRETQTDLVEVTVYHLEMLSANRRDVPRPSGKLQILDVESPSVSYYRFLYNAVGKDYRWLSRRKLTDEQLAEVIQHPDTKIFVLHVDGSPAGFAELDYRDGTNVELVQFGLMGDYHGRGLGTWFLNEIIRNVWTSSPRRFWLHTCTFDHPAALKLYQNAGFQLFKQEKLQREY